VSAYQLGGVSLPLSLNFYRILFNGYYVIGGIKGCIWADFGEENHARGGSVHKLVKSSNLRNKYDLRNRYNLRIGYNLRIKRNYGGLF